MTLDDAIALPAARISTGVGDYRGGPVCFRCRRTVERFSARRVGMQEIYDDPFEAPVGFTWQGDRYRVECHGEYEEIYIPAMLADDVPGSIRYSYAFDPTGSDDPRVKRGRVRK